MKLLMLGASGGCGQWVTQLAVKRGHNVRALVRESSAYHAPKGVELLTGNVLEAEVLQQALAGVDRVISCLGLRRRQPWNPWAALISPPSLVATVTRMLVNEMHRQGVSKLVVISAGGVGGSAQHIHPMNRWLFSNSNIGLAYRDLEETEQILKESTLDWYAVRPTTLTNGTPTGRAAPVNYYGFLSRIRRADVADWMLDVVEDAAGTDASRTPMLATARNSLRTKKT